MVLSFVASALISFIPNTLRITQVIHASEHVTIETVPWLTSADCPICRMSSERVHSVYRRVLQDLPWQGRPVTLHVAARRFLCLNRTCARRTFVERLPDVARLSGRRTSRLRDLHYHLGLALGGEAGARLASRLATPISADTLLRLASSCPDNGARRATPQVLGIDDWAWRRGHRYGTVLVDLERNEVVDLLPDREAATVAAWLQDHPGVRIVARDRASAYADGIRKGAPGAVQVADRWHLLRNLGEAVRAIADRHAAAAGRAAQCVRMELQAVIEQSPVSSPQPLLLTTAQRNSDVSRVRRQLRYEEAARLRAEGASISRVAAEVGAERKTVQRWLRLGRAPSWKKPPRDRMLDPFADFLQRR